MRKATNILTLLVLAAGMLLTSSCQESKTARFERETREFTEKQCPKIIGPEKMFTLDSLVFHDDGTNDFIYYYSVKTDSIGINSFNEKRDELTNMLISGIINSPELRHVKEAGLNIVYVYKNAEDNKEIARFTFTKDDYE